MRRRILIALGLLAAIGVGLSFDKLRVIYGKVLYSYQSGYLLQNLNDTFWDYFGLDYWTVEDPAERAQLPLYKIIPGAPPETLTPANGAPDRRVFIDWHRGNGDHGSTRYSLLDQINTGNVHELEVAWIYQSNDGTNNIGTAPVIADGVLYTPTGGDFLVALEANTGRELWRYKAPLGEPARRGLVWWPGDDQHPPRIYFSSRTKFIALDAKTGEPVKSFGTEGIVETVARSKIAPAIAKGKIVTATFLPSVEAFDLITGSPQWKFDLLTPEDRDHPAPRTFKLHGGHPWGGMSMDVERGIAYVTTGNAYPLLVGVDRPGRNLYTVSIVALDVETGHELWHFQDIRHDLWNLGMPAPPVLTTIQRDGRRVDVVVAMSKFGNVMVLDRISGAPVFDVRLRRAPTSKVPGEKTWPYQPSLELPQPISRQEFTLDTVTNIGEANRESVLRQLEDTNYGFLEPPEVGRETIIFGSHGGTQWTGGAVDPDSGILYISANDIPFKLSVVNAAKPFDESTLPLTPGRRVYQTRCMACHGANREGSEGPALIWISLTKTRAEIAEIVRRGREGMPAVAGLSEQDLEDLLKYLHERDTLIEAERGDTKSGKHFYFQRKDERRLKDHEGYPGSIPPWGHLNAMDLASGKILWKVPLGEYAELSERGVPKTGTENHGGATVTAGGLVFVAGTLDKKIRAFDKRTGRELWQHDLPFGGFAPPATYEVGGRQYVFIAATGGGAMVGLPGTESGDAFVAFALPKTGSN